VKGMLVEFASAFGATNPNVIPFQFNPETLRRTWTQPEPATAGGNPLGVRGMPGESYALTLMLDVTDELAGDPLSPRTMNAVAGGLGSRIAALEMLMFPVPATSTAAPGGSQARQRGRATPAAVVPAVLFIWGHARILPVRITALSITEKLFDEYLNPTHATVELSFRVMTPQELDAVTGPFKNIASAAYRYSQAQREALAVFNLSAAAGTNDLPHLPGT
jgi:hypothetical protein